MMVSNRIVHVGVSVTLMLVFALQTSPIQAAGRSGQEHPAVTGGMDTAGNVANHQVDAAIAIYDVKPEATSDFEKQAAQVMSELSHKPTFINGRLLRNMDSMAAQYAIYVKFIDIQQANAALAQFTINLQKLCRRAPENHVAVLSHAYSPAGDTAHPNGRDFGGDRVGQVAHLGLFVPFPTYRDEYDKVLHETKMLTLDDKPRGYIGEDVLSEAVPVAPLVQTPYSPHAREETQMSFNYGEYNTMEDAEDSYIAREEKQDPKLITMERVFYSALQVPTRFYIFQVIGNVGAAGQRQVAKQHMFRGAPQGN